MMELITTRERFVEFARELGVRHDWHEPDEQDLTARVEGTPLDFDNAGFWPTDVVMPAPNGWPTNVELHVVFSERFVEEGRAVRGRDLAAVNLATLCAWASEPA